jgi:DNA mismatch endonuclease (patch repair protein)
VTPEQRSRAMQRVRLKGGPLEVLIQQELRKVGLRYRRNYKRLRGTPDIAFPEKKVAIFIDGDFWHGWRLPAWEHKLSQFWKLKLQANRRRDQRNFRRLRAADWTVIRLWEHQIRSDCERCIRRIIRAVSESATDSLGVRKNRAPLQRTAIYGNQLLNDSAIHRGLRSSPRQQPL